MPIKTYLTSEEIQNMVEAAPCLRDKVIISFYSDVGCRVSELLQVTVDQLDFKRNIVLIPHLKSGIRKRCPICFKNAGRRQPFCSKCGASLVNVIAEGIEERKRLVSVGKETMTLVKEYIEKRENPDGRLINLTRQSVYYIVRNAAEKAGLAGKTIMNPETGKLHYVHPHNFRDSLAVAWLDLAGSDAGKQKALQDHLGHKRFETTMRYHKLTPTDVQEVGDEVRKKRFKERHG